MKSNRAPFVLTLVLTMFASSFFAQDIIKLNLNVPEGAHVLVSNAAFANMDIASVNGKVNLDLNANEFYELKVEKEGFMSQNINVDTHSEAYKASSLCEFTVHLYANEDCTEWHDIKPITLKESLFSATPEH